MRIDRGVHRVLLHAHEVGEGVVEIEDDGFDHVILAVAAPILRAAAMETGVSEGHHNG